MLETKIRRSREAGNVLKLLNTDYINDLDQNPEKAFLLGWLLSNCFTDKKNLALAKYYFEKAMDQGHFRAMYNLGLLMREGLIDGSMEEAFKLIERSAEYGYGRAWSTLGFLYEQGLGVEVDLEKSEECFEKAIECGHVVSVCNLAYLYLFDEAYSERLSEKLPLIMRYLTQGEELGHPGSIYILGRIYHLGILGSPDIESALEYYQKGIEREHYASYKALSSYYFSKIQQEVESGKLGSISIEHLETFFQKGEVFEAKYQDSLEERNDPLNRYRSYQAQVEIGGYEFKNSWHFISVISRPSVIKEDLLPHSCLGHLIGSENLEWVGDAILNTSVRSKLFTLFPERKRGDLNQRYQYFICNANEEHQHGGSLYRVAKHIKIEPLLMIGQEDPLRKYPRRGFHKKKKTVESQLSNHVEMLVSAICLDDREITASNFVLKHWESLGLNSEEDSEDGYGLSDDECLDERILKKGTPDFF